MTKQFLLVGFALILFLGFMSYRTTLSLFSDASQSTGNVFGAATAFPTAIPSVTSTPSTTPNPIANHLAVNEVLYDPSTGQTPGGQGGANRDEFVEIYNPTASSVNVQNWVLNADGSNVTLPNTSIPASGFLIISGSTQPELEAIYTIPAGTVFFTTSGGKVGNGFDDSGGIIQLSNNSATLIDQLSYGNDTTVFNPAIPDVITGHSFERDPDGKDTDTAADFVDRTTPQPGQ